MYLFNMKRFVKKNLTKKNDLISQCVALNSKSGRDFSLELRELVLAFEDMITTFTTLLYFNLW